MRYRTTRIEDNPPRPRATTPAPLTDAELAEDERTCARLPVTPEETDAYRQRACTRYPALVAEVRSLHADLAKVMAEREEARGDATRFLSCIETEREKAAELAALVTAAFARDRAERDALRAENARLRAANADYVEAYRHTHVAHYKTVGDQDILTDMCDRCGFDLRDPLHWPQSDAPPPADDDAAPGVPRLSVDYPHAPTAPLGEAGVLTVDGKASR